MFFLRKLTLIALMGVLAACGRESLPMNDQANSAAGIINGEVPKQSSIATQATVLIVDQNKGSLCTGTLIEPNVVLTAAHCAPGEASDLVVSWGLNPLSEDAPIVSVTKIIRHKKYAPNSSEDRNDIAVLKLESAAAGMTPALLPTAPVQDGTDFLAMGYGLRDGKANSLTDEQKTKLSGSLRKTRLKAITFEPGESDNEFYVDQAKSGVCSGDSGSPAFQVNFWQTSATVIGVASAVFHPIEMDDFRPQFNFCNKYALYTQVWPHLPWIKKSLRELQAK